MASYNIVLGGWLGPVVAPVEIRYDPAAWEPTGLGVGMVAMVELFWAAVAPVNLPYTILLALLVGYWLLYVLGFFGSEALDLLNLDLDADAGGDLDAGVDVDGGVGADADVDADVDADAGTGGAGGVLTALLRFVYAGDLPILIIVTILVTSMWTFSIAINHLLGNSSGWIALGLFFPNFLISLMVTRLVLRPFVPFLRQVFEQRSDRVEILGKRCVITSLEATPQYGQAEIATGGAPIRLNVVTRHGITMKRGEEGVVFEHDEVRDAYVVAPLGLGKQSDREN
ncbi:MAG TPA: hypothetical protein EYP56_03440 [Planctomycetaceae bacterium]|nr:hypothetical protein [Planctomycetaceae bacterium]